MATSQFGTANDFRANLQKFAEKQKRDVNRLFVGVALRALENVVRRTPVGDPSLWQSPAPKGYLGGTARNSWHVTLGQPSSEEVKNGADKSGGGAMREGAAAINQAKLGDTIYLNNTVPYIRRLEYGHSTQAPEGMVRVTLSEIETFYRQGAQQ